MPPRGPKMPSLLRPAAIALPDLPLGILLEDPHNDSGLARFDLALTLDRVAGSIERTDRAVAVAAAAREAAFEHCTLQVALGLHRDGLEADGVHEAFECWEERRVGKEGG